jgi:hypothetical protein
VNTKKSEVVSKYVMATSKARHFRNKPTFDGEVWVLATLDVREAAAIVEGSKTDEEDGVKDDSARE